MLQSYRDITNMLCLSATQVGHTFDFAFAMWRSAKHLGCCLFELVHSKSGHKPAFGADSLRKCPEHCGDSWQSNGGTDKSAKHCLIQFSHHCSGRFPTKIKWLVQPWEDSIAIATGLGSRWILGSRKPSFLGDLPSPTPPLVL